MISTFSHRTQLIFSSSPSISRPISASSKSTLTMSNSWPLYKHFMPAPYLRWLNSSTVILLVFNSKAVLSLRSIKPPSNL